MARVVVGISCVVVDFVPAGMVMRHDLSMMVSSAVTVTIGSGGLALGSGWVVVVELKRRPAIQIKVGRECMCHGIRR